MSFDRIFGEKGGKGDSGSSAAASEQPNTLQSRSTAKIVEIISHGECVGLADSVNPLKSVYLNSTPIQDPGGTLNFSGVDLQQRAGLPDQDPFTGFSDTESPISIGTAILHATPQIYTVTNNFINAVRVQVQIVALTQQDQTSGSLNGATVSYTIGSRIVGGSFTDVLTETLNDKCTTSQDLSYRIERPAAASDSDDWEVRVTRNTADSTTVFLQNGIVLDSVTEITDSNLQYADYAAVALQIDSKQFGSSIPTRSYDFIGMVLDVPSNYTPPNPLNPNDVTKRVYTGIWDGTFKRAWTDCPAWILWAMLTDKDWGMGKAIQTYQIDKWALYQIAQYCDAFVPDGLGGQEPRYTLNTQVTSAEQAYAVLQAIASTFHGLLYWGTGTATFSADQPRDPVRLVSPVNVIDGKFSYQGSALKARHSVARVTWNDPNDQHRQSVEVVESPSMIDRFGWRPVDVTAYGCTSRGRAARFGKWILDTEQHENETVTYQASFDHADVRPGQIINLYDPNWAGIRMAGRIVTPGATTMTADAQVLLQAGQTYTLSMVRPDGSLVTRTLTNSTPSTTNGFTWSSTIAALPATSSAITITSKDLVSGVQIQQIKTVGTTSVTFEQAVVLLNGTSYSITFTLPNGTTLVRPITTAVTSGQRLGTTNYYELLTLAWTATLGATLPNVNSTAFVAPSGEGSFARTVSAITSNTCTLNSSITFTPGYTYVATFALPDGSTITRQIGSANMLADPQAIDGGSWTRSAATVSANATTDPLGTSTADKLVETATTAVHYARALVTTVTGFQYSASAYVKAAGTNFARVLVSDGTNGYGANVNLTTGAFTIATLGATPTGANVTADNAGSGWWRVKATANSPSNTFGILINPQTTLGTDSYLGNTSNGIYVANEKFEQGSPTPFSTNTLISWLGNLDDLPTTGGLWALTASNLAPRQYRVIGMRETAGNLFEITALNYDVNKYSRIETGHTVVAPPTTIYSSELIPAPPSNITVVRNPVLNPDGTYYDSIVIHWDKAVSSLVSHYKVAYKWGSNPWVQLADSYSTSSSFTSPGPGDYTFSVIAVTYLNKQSSATYVTLTLNNARPFNGALITNIHLQT